MKKDNPIFIIVVVVVFFTNGLLADNNWGNEISRACLAVFNIFWTLGVGVYIGIKD